MQPSESNRAHALAYAQRMNRVLDHIDRHLDQALDLPTLADVAHFSAFHFHRLFAAWTGETLGDYLRRRRLDVAAVHLANHPRRTVLDVALAVGFGSGEAFARAFKLRFGCTPSAWREQTPQRWAVELQTVRAVAQQSKQDQAGSRPRQTSADGKGHAEPPRAGAFDGRQDQHPARVVYRRHVGPYGPSVGDPARFRYDACVEVRAG